MRQPSAGTPTGPSGPRRRTVLGAGAGAGVGIAALLAGCAPAGAPVSRRRTPPYTIDDLLAEDTFFIAHRGSGDNWPEHTMEAYRAATAAGAMALEVSVHATKDGVLVCHHDGNTKRMTGVDREIADTTWAQLSALRVNARRWLGPSTQLAPIPRLSDVLAAFADTHVLFVEDKTGTHDTEVLDALLAHRDATQRIVWKQHVGGPNLKAATDRGLRTWGYFTTHELDVFDQNKDRFDLLGLIREADDNAFRRFVATGKPVICWEVHRRSDLTRLQGLGVRGMMCSNFPYVTSPDAAVTRDQFASGRRSPGDLPYLIGGDWVTQPQWLGEDAALRMAHTTNTSYVLGSLCPVDRDSHSLRWSMRWPTTMPTSNQHAGIALGQDTDEVYRPTLPSTVGGYHVILRANGQVGIYRRDPGQAAGTLLADFRSPAPKVGQWVSLNVDVTRTTLIIYRDGDDTWTAGAKDDTYRGGYLSLCKNYPGTVPVDFKGVRID
ncbi:glycerophosphodiester phosphodiesterase family protein [Tersicoccus sp. Bi-70]|uniref:glycerophosphodiester phosphodiesterase n=1 Tax=Tersicoccus sp. Bi-70 TaxID=1897634 RepID=UPI000975CBAB|nr:glycerophosphodiester phosphodiesterase family protein [Tersicoccus sp. Bi-70]OMH31360.1 hypothetical protein BGP79_10105 [Tersicoccus sp. Bi-70]